MKPAFSMIELVISIVVMGIVVMSLPLILVQTQKNNAFIISQEAILAAKAKMGLILSYEWDTNSYQEDISPYGFVLDTSANADSNNIYDTNSTFRKGHIDEELRRRVYDQSVVKRTPTAIANAQNNEIGYFNNKADTIAVIPENYDFIFDLTLTPKVKYISDTFIVNGNVATFNLDIANAKNETNIKMIEIESESSHYDKPFSTIRSFSANIGESPLLRRTF